MNNQKKLELTICGMLPYDLEYISVNSGIRANVTFLNTEKLFKESEKYKPILHSLDKLTKEIEHKGEKFFPLEVIGKIIDKDYTLLHFDGEDVIIGKDINPRCGHPYDCDCTEYTHDLFYKDFNFYSTIYQDGNPNNIIGEYVFESYLLIEKLKEWHFNIYDLPKEMYIEKSTL